MVIKNSQNSLESFFQTEPMTYVFFFGTGHFHISEGMNN